MSLGKETEIANYEAEFSQGDIIRLDHHSPEETPKLGVIINADCDLANNNIDGIIAYLPIYTFKEYVELFWSRMFIRDAKIKYTSDINVILNTDPKYNTDLIDLLTKVDHEEVLNKLLKAKLLPKNKEKLAKATLERLSICVKYEENPFEGFKTFCNLENNSPAYIKKQLNIARKSTGEGHFFITDLVDHENIGFLVRMRRIYTIKLESCFKTHHRQKMSNTGLETSATRFAKLTPLFRFKIIQLFSNQFSRVGLPDEITALADLAIEDLTSRFSGEFSCNH